MITKQLFGRTGHLSSRAIFGGFALSEASQKEADPVLDILLKYGVNHIDTAADYGDSELRIGPWMEQHRQDFFLASKTGERTYQGAYDSIRRSLERLRVDHIDLLQLHNLVEPAEWETALAENGALQAAIKAREEGLIRFIGVTGHGYQAAAIHKRSLGRFDFDTVLLPYNRIMMQHDQYRTDFEALTALCRKRQTAVQLIKTASHKPWGNQPQTRHTWYKPLEDQANIDRAIQWVLQQQPDDFLITAGDIGLLPQILDAASRFQTDAPPAEVEALSVELAPIFSSLPDSKPISPD